MSYNAYARAQRESGAPRDAEYRAFVTATRALIDAKKPDCAPARFAEALHVNRTLWALLADDCAKPQNGLPEATRGQIIGLSRWVAAYSRDLLRKKGEVDALIDINRIMMDGLAGKTAPSAPADPAA